MKMIRLLIVDDSPTIRALIRQSVSRAPDIEVVGEAVDPIDAREAIKRLNPDVITLDIEMPRMDGLSFLEKIMRLRPMPVLIISTLTRRGADVTLRALEGGALDCIEKPRPGNEDSFAELPERIRIASRANVSAHAARVAPSQHMPSQRQAVHAGRGPSLIAIGASTGGVEALLAVIGSFPANCAPTVIVQHMPPLFTASFAQRLNRTCAAEVAEATSGAVLAPGKVYIAPGGDAHLEIAGTGEKRCVLRTAERVNHHCPSVDVLFRSVVRVCGADAAGVLLTGMGKDGAEGLLDLRRAGAHTVVQDESTSVVYGMPRAAFEIGAASIQLPLHELTYQAIVAPEPAGSRSSRSKLASGRLG